jgi:ribose-phosphate pyrophosphokinase
VADLISNSYVKRVFLLDLHNSSIPGFFCIPTHHLSAIDVYASYVKTTFGDLTNFVVASPDFGGLKRARVFADKLGLELINIDKHRDLTTGKVEAVGMSGSASGKSVLIYDDVINGGSTVHTTAELLKENGATAVHFLATHGPLVGSAHEKLAQAPVDSIVVTNSLMQLEKPANMVVLDVAPLFATELSSWYNGK